jgi:sigma-B regulation protein RsbU (phosphoserine phosphatase)
VGFIGSAEPDPVAGIEENRRYGSKSLRLGPGDTLLLYTDGVTEAENHQQQQFSEERLKTFFSEHRALPLEELIAAICADITEFVQGHPQSDDITLLALRYKGS